MEAPQRLADALLSFYEKADSLPATGCVS